MNSGNKAPAFYKKKYTIVLLQILVIFSKIGLFIWLYTFLPINRIVVVISYIVIAPSITWLLKKISPSEELSKIHYNSLFISYCVLYLLIFLLGSLINIDFNSELLNYISTLLFAILVYYFMGHDYSKKTYDLSTAKGFYAYAYSIISKEYNLYFIRTLIFVFYTFVLIFGQLRDLGIHNSSLFKYEQYAIILIIAIDRIVNSFTKEFSIVKMHKKEMYTQMIIDKIKEIKEQFELLLKINPEYDIEKLDLWENANDPEHPQTKLLHLYLLLSTSNSDKLDELFIHTGKSVKQSHETV